MSNGAGETAGSVPASAIPDDVKIDGTAIAPDCDVVTVAEKGGNGVGDGLAVASNGPSVLVHAASTIAVAKNTPSPAYRENAETRIFLGYQTNLIPS